MQYSSNWKDYELIDLGDGEKLERWGSYVLRRPDPQAIWPKDDSIKLWNSPHGHYHRSKTGGGSWEFFKNIPSKWTISYGDLKFYIEPTGFKHTGLFPEQAFNWDWMMQKIRGAKRPVRVLNLFAYTGGATVACASAGAEVCHVDAAKGMVNRAKENITLSGLLDRHVRFITDDVFKFVEREIRRGSRYDGVIMDPPSYGRGPKGEVWKIEDELYNLIKLCQNVLTENPLFFLINSYTSGFSPTVVENILKISNLSKLNGHISSGEIGLKSRNLILPCGIYGRWENANAL